MRTLPPARAIAEFDSASAMLRATARALCGQDFPHLGQSEPRAAMVRASALLPEPVRTRMYSLAGGSEGVPVDRLGSVDMSEIARWVTGHYPAGGYPGVVIGSSSGSMVHACAVAGVPWLPQTLLVPVQAPQLDSEDAVGAMAFGRKVAPPLLERNSDVVLHHMHDGNQDRLMASRIAYFRLKWRRLPEAYERFLVESLRPGAPVLIFEDRSTWPTTRVAERHVFQTGAYGGISPDEYLHGSSAVANFLHSYGSSRDRFAAPEPDGTSAEAEWGFEAALRDHIEDCARRTGHPVLRLSTPSPQHLSGPVAEQLRQRQRDAGRDSKDVLVESFVMLDPVQANRTGLAPFWSVFGVRRSAHALAEYVVARYDHDDPVRDLYVLSFPHGVRSAGAAAPDDWTALSPYIEGKVRLLRGTTARWPAHFDSLARYGPALRSLPGLGGDIGPVPLSDIVHELTAGLLEVKFS